MTIETTILDFQLSNTYEEYESHMNAKEQQTMFKEMGVKTFYIGKSLDDPQRATVIFQGPENVLYDIFMNPETIPVAARTFLCEGQKSLSGFLGKINLS